MNWHITDPRIRCVADRDGAQVFIVHRHGREIRVLTFSQEAADLLAASEQEQPETKEETLL